MRLLRLEVKGFKSFGRETIINFSESVTGIVGPNGSGKSNVVDAIRWVLGEQKTSGLRLEKMGDVLFNGTSKKKPSNAASVSIVFENNKNVLPTEYGEVKVTRMLFKSGHSEYRLNDVPCRLKDITNLLVDTGISANSYAIIELGMIDDILADKDNARRKMFEQAAGISKFKKRKRETELKLRATNADLERVEDLLHEIRNNLKSLSRQANKARRYLKLKAKYREKSINQAILNLSDLKATNEKLKGQISHEQDKYHDISGVLRVKESELEREKATNLEKSDSLSALQKELNELINDIRSIEHNIKLAEQEIEFSRRKVDSAQARRQRDEEQVAILEESLGNQKQAIEAAAEQVDKLNEELRQQQEIREEVASVHSHGQHAHQALIDRQMQIEKELFDVDKEMALIENNLTNHQNRLSQLQSSSERIALRKDEVKQQIHALDEQFAGARARLDELEGSLEERVAYRKALEAELQAISDQQASIGRKLDARKNEWQLTKSMVDNLEGYPNSIKFLSKQTDWRKGAVLFSEILQVDEPYKAALEQFVEPYLNFYVVEDLDTAHAGISMLQDAQEGRAHFFVLEGFDEAPAPAKPLPGLTPATAVVVVGAPYEIMVHSLLSGVYIAEDAAALPGEWHSDITVIAKDGHLIRRPNQLSGGSVGLFDGKKIGRKRNLQKLQKEVDELERDHQLVTDRKLKLKARLARVDSEDLTASLEEQKKEVQQFNLERTRHASQLDELNEQLSRNNQDAENIRGGIADFQENLALRKVRHNDLSDKLNALKRDLTGTSDQLESSSAALTEASQAYNAKHVEYIKAQNGLAGLEREFNYKSEQLKEYRSDYKRSSEEIRAANATIEDNGNKINRWRESLSEAYERKKQKELDLSDREKDYFKARDTIHQLEKEISRLNAAYRQQQSLINELKDTHNEVKFNMQNVGQRIQVEFNVSLEALMEMPVPDDDLEQITEEVERLRQRIFNFGEVNPLAVEAHDEMQERYDNIVAQRDDILEAQKTLEATIMELEETATRKFLDAFFDVREHFKDIFRTLFKEGDDCDLVLLDSDNPLESKVEIIAKPKGKRPVTLSQLSGGEKTLTATALLFALYLLKPAPFCVFDEVDAPLDDANVFKFNHIIREFSGASQFVIITHNKLTMAEVDVIYGVYMDEPGISSVTPVDFRKFQHEPLPTEMVGN